MNENQPRAVIHKRILEAASEQPEASIEVIAETVSGASPTLVEGVLEEYGDPGRPAEDIATADGSTEPLEPSTGGPAPDWDDVPITRLTGKQLRLLYTVHRYPGATQSDLACILDTSQSSISELVARTAGLSWRDRHEFANRIFGQQTSYPDEDPVVASVLPLLRTRAGELDGATPEHLPAEPPAVDPTLAMKVIRVCMDSGQFTEPEQESLVEWILVSL